MELRPLRTALVFTTVWFAAAGVPAGTTGRLFRIPNALGLDWPGELIYFDVQGSLPDEPCVIETRGRIRPLQCEPGPAA